MDSQRTIDMTVSSAESNTSRIIELIESTVEKANQGKLVEVKTQIRYMKRLATEANKNGSSDSLHLEPLIKTTEKNVDKILTSRGYYHLLSGVRKAVETNQHSVGINDSLLRAKQIRQKTHLFYLPDWIPDEVSFFTWGLMLKYPKYFEKEKSLRRNGAYA